MEYEKLHYVLTVNFGKRGFGGLASTKNSAVSKGKDAKLLLRNNILAIPAISDTWWSYVISVCHIIHTWTTQIRGIVEAVHETVDRIWFEGCVKHAILDNIVSGTMPLMLPYHTWNNQNPLMINRSCYQIWRLEDFYIQVNVR